MAKIRIDKKSSEQVLRWHEKLIDQVLHRVGKDTVKHLQGYSGEVTTWKPVDAEHEARIRRRIEAKFSIFLKYAARNLEKRKNLGEWSAEKLARQYVESRIRRTISSVNAKRRARAGRPKHPGGWADVTRHLRDHYSYELRRVGNGWLLVIKNSARHAHLVEMHDGVFVVRGVTDPGGPLHRALKQAVRDIAPHWEVR